MKWVEITVLTATPAVEAIANILLECRSGGVAEESTPTGGVLLRGYLPVGPATGVTLSAIKDRIRTLPTFGLDIGPATVQTEEIEDEGWAHAWKIHFKPFAIGRLWITPTWDHTRPAHGEVTVELDPGMAFGSGLHPSTQMCLMMLSRGLRGGETVFDVGTGSGILSIAAAKLGAARVLARDDDPVAVEVARHNVAYNCVDDRVTVEEGHLLAGVEGQANLIMANLIADIHLDFLPDAFHSLLPGGLLAASGIIADRLLEVTSVASAAGFRVAEIVQSAEWRCAILSRPGA
ncbi:MAG: 50S ribosomal protein L11 methyltransferase [bacterium]